MELIEGGDNMASSKVPVATTIPLVSMDGDEFYAVITQEEINKKKWNIMWLFRKGCGVAHFCMDKTADSDDGTMTSDGIKALDAIGHFDERKELLMEEK